MIAGENQIVVYQPNETVRLDVRLDAYPGVATLDMLAKRGRGGSSLGHRSIYSKNIYRRGRPFC